MKKLILSIVAIATITLSSYGQAPEGFKYQAVVRDAGNTILNNQAVGMRMTIQQGSIGGTTVYQETFLPTTNAYGLVNLEIGNGTVVSGDLTTIDWSAGPYFIETAVDVTGGTSYVVMGTSQLMSVPYALHANTAENVTNDLVDDADADPTNEMNTGVVLNGTALEVTDGNGTIVTDLSSLQDGVNDADADPTNEMNAGVVLNGTDLEVTDGNGTIVTDLSLLQDGVNDADADPLNELQALSLSNDTLYLSDGNNVYMGDIGATNNSGAGGRPSIGGTCTGGCWSLPGWNIGGGTFLGHDLNPGCGFIPIYIDKQTSFQSIGGVFNATNLCRLAIYSWNDGVPDTLIVDFGLTPGGPTPTIVNSFSLQQGFYFIAVGTDNGVTSGGLELDAYTSPVSGKTWHMGQAHSNKVVLLQTGTEFVDYTAGFPTQIIGPFTSGYDFFYPIRLRETP